MKSKKEYKSLYQNGILKISLISFGEIPEIDIVFTSEPVIARTRKLKEIWTQELEQELLSCHFGVDKSH